jgi:hypothetical protein
MGAASAAAGERAAPLPLGPPLAGDALERAFSKVGDRGLSAQVAHEEGTPIATFVQGGKLHVVAESRESDSPINEDMKTLLEAKRKSAAKRPGAYAAPPAPKIGQATRRLLAMRDDDANE